MIDLTAIEARLAAATPYLWQMGKNTDATFIADAFVDIAALIAEVERLRAVLDGPPICACGGDITEVEYETEDGEPRAFGYHCFACHWEIGNNGEITERLTLRTNPQTARFVARIFGQ